MALCPTRAPPPGPDDTVAFRLDARIGALHRAECWRRNIQFGSRALHVQLAWQWLIQALAFESAWIQALAFESAWGYQRECMRMRWRQGADAARRLLHRVHLDASEAAALEAHVARRLLHARMQEADVARRLHARVQAAARLHARGYNQWPNFSVQPQPQNSDAE